MLFVAIIFGYFWKFRSTVDVVGEFDSGFDAPELVNVKMIKLVLVDAFVIAITGYFTNLAVEQRISVDVRQDPVNVALISGLANCVSGIFHGLPDRVGNLSEFISRAS